MNNNNSAYADNNNLCAGMGDGSGVQPLKVMKDGTEKFFQTVQSGRGIVGDPLAKDKNNPGGGPAQFFSRGFGPGMVGDKVASRPLGGSFSVNGGVTQ